MVAPSSCVSSRSDMNWNEGSDRAIAVSPWQFKSLGGDGWVEQSDTLWNYRWKQAVDEVHPDIVEIVTWNDYGEAHYISGKFV